MYIALAYTIVFARVSMINICSFIILVGWMEGENENECRATGKKKVRQGEGRNVLYVLCMHTCILLPKKRGKGKRKGMDELKNEKKKN